MKITDVIAETKINEISADPAYLRAAERSLSQARDTQRQYWRSPEEKAAARRTELKREKGIAGYSKRHRAANPEMYPKVTAKSAPKLRDPSTEYSDDYSTWAKGRRDTMEQGVAEGSDELYQQAIRKYVQRVANNYLGGGNAHLYGAGNFDSEMFGVDPKQAEKDFDILFPQYLKKLQGGGQGVAEGEDGKQSFKVSYYNPKTRQNKVVKIKAHNKDAVLDHCANKGYKDVHVEEYTSEDWQKVNKKDKTDGMSQKAVNAYRRENPGSKLKTAVTTKPSKLKKGSKAAKRRKSFCARMSGMKKAHASAKTKRDPDSPINKALRRWNCESIEDMRNLIEHAERVIAEEKVRLDPKCWKGKKIGNPKTKMKGGVRVNNCVPAESVSEASSPAQQAAIAISMKKAGKKPKNQKVNEGKMAEVDLIIRALVDGDMDAYTVMNHPKSDTEQYVSRILHNEYKEVARNHRLHPDDDFEQILDIVVDNLAKDYGIL